MLNSVALSGKREITELWEEHILLSLVKETEEHLVRMSKNQVAGWEVTTNVFTAAICHEFPTFLAKFILLHSCVCRAFGFQYL